jgi:hypothetical protein
MSSNIQSIGPNNTTNFQALEEEKTETIVIEEKKEYSLDDVIEKIVNLAGKEEVKLGLFVGRNCIETLPEEMDWNWVSLSSMTEDGKPPEGRLHLRIDFNTAQLEKIHGLFDKIIVDRSVLKFFMKNPWVALSACLKQKEASQLITMPRASCSPVLTDEIPEETLDLKECLINDTLYISKSELLSECKEKKSFEEEFELKKKKNSFTEEEKNELLSYYKENEIDPKKNNLKIIYAKMKIEKKNGLSVEDKYRIKKDLLKAECLK